ncbi:MAG: hypothetical protein COW03_17285 [Cytophagales bacterium CG12_big_fil_rev_8_21_14_0_65_40_12]|nr:MAG: hypothetical protein COW03_17285 [Cytophagales bacterium CG12_big_fil_rev_8_21_14_0_65_40_12]PIW02961.1 MAG: hypothetical protein COW40_16550 [Cytophagales bacterium CG17_big_fil_post_rev_8_21_14_2_50_40_13]
MINQAQTKIIRDYLLGEGFTHVDLLDDLADHISCKIEMLLTDSDISFENALLIARQEVIPDYALQIEDDLKFLTTKKQNTMIKKLAFIGGYASAVCLCLSILFFSQSLLGSKRSQLKIEATQVEMMMENQMNGEVSASNISSDLTEYHRRNLISSFNKFEMAETFLIISFALFAVFYLPYKFYSNYQRTDQEFYHA